MGDEMESRRVIGIEQLREAQATLEKYRSGKANLDNKLIANEDWWKLNHYGKFGHIKYIKDETGQVVPIDDHPRIVKQSSWLFKSVMNKHADIMDNYPEPAILAQAPDDEAVAKTLSSVVPVILERSQFEEIYSDNSWDKLCFGAAVYAVVWNSDLLNGLGDIEVRPVDMLNLYWEPGIQELEDSQNVFLLSLMDKTILEQTYPQTKDKLTGTAINAKEYNYDDTVDTTDKAIVVDWYYKLKDGTRTVLHYCKFVDDIVLYASEEDPQCADGFYRHGRYPFIIDNLFREKGTPAGFGYIDVMKNTQEYIDQLGTDILRNAQWGARPRYFARDDADINLLELRNLDQEIVHVSGPLDEMHIRSIDTKGLDSSYLNVYQMKIDELKETSGNRDFSNGATASGVTSGSAIAALQEAGSKGSRDMIKGSYRAFRQICELVIELIRQFYDAPRTFRITGDNGQDEFVDFSNAGLNPPPQVIMGEEFKTKEPVFDIKIKAQKSSPYARLSQNELALQFYNLGFFNPQLSDQALATIEMMDFEGKDKVKERIQANGTMFQQLQQMQQTMAQMAQVMAETTGDTRVMDALAQQGVAQPSPQPSGGPVRIDEPDADGRELGNSEADKMRRRIQNSTEVR